jgi:hypothetical protein
MDGVSDTVDHQMRILCKEGSEPRSYYRFQTKLDSALDDMDNATRANIEALKREAEEIIRDNDAALDELCVRLRALSLARRAPTRPRPDSAPVSRGVVRPRSVRPEDLVALPEEFDVFHDHPLDPAPRREGNDAVLRR